MEIKASCVYNKEAIKALSRASLMKGKTHPAILLVIFGVFTVAYVTSLILQIINGELDYLSLFLTVFAIGIDLFFFYMYFLLPGKQYKMMAKTADLKNAYVFTDECFMIFSDNEYIEAKEKINYPVLVSVKETKDYLLLYIRKGTAFIVDKRTFENDEFFSVQSKLVEVLGKNYIICNY